MQIFRTFGQEPESGDISQIPGYSRLAEEAQKTVSETYQNTYQANQGKGIKIAQGIAFATAKMVVEEILSEQRCPHCGRQMREVHKSNAVHKFCPVCNPKSVGYGDVRRMKEDELKEFSYGPDIQDPGHKRTKFHATLAKHGFTYNNSSHTGTAKVHRYSHPEHGSVHTIHGEGPAEWYHTPKGATQTKQWHDSPAVLDRVLSHKPTVKEDDSSSMQKQNVITKDSQEEKPNKVGTWGTSPAYPPGSPEGAGAIQKQNWTSKGFGPTTESEWGEPEDHAPGATYEGEKYEGFNKLKGELAHKKGVTDPGGLAAYIGKKKYGSAGFNTHKHMGESEDAHGNHRNPISTTHASYRAGQRYGEKLGKAAGVTDPKSLIHASSAKHLRDTHGGATLQAKLDAQRHYKAGAHATFKKHTGIDLSEDDSKQLQTKNFEEKCDYCGKIHAVGPCPAMQETEVPYDDKKNTNESEWGEPEEHEPGATYEDEIHENYENIKSGDRVTARVPGGMGRNGREYSNKSGRAVMKGPHGWVLNMGGKHGTPHVVSPEHYVSHTTSKTSKPDHLGNFLHSESASHFVVKHKDMKRDDQDFSHFDHEKEAHDHAKDMAERHGIASVHKLEGPKSTLVKTYRQIPVHEETMQEMNKHAICFCGHEFGSHNSKGCKSCHKEGHVRPEMAAHGFKPNPSVRMESIIQASVDYIAARMNIKGITEGAMPKPLAMTKDKWSNSFQINEEEETRHELFYGSGGHGGPYPSHEAAAKRAAALLRGSSSEKHIHIHPYSKEGVGGYGSKVGTVSKNSEGGITHHNMTSGTKRAMD